MDGDSLIPKDALKREVAAALAWPAHLAVWMGESLEQIGPSDDGEVHGLATITCTIEQQGGMGEDIEVTFPSNVRVRTQKGSRMLKLEVRIEHLGLYANDLGSKLERRLRGEGPQERLLNPQDGQPPISLLEFNLLRNVPFSANGHVQSAAILEIDAMVGYSEVDTNASPDWFDTATAPGDV